MSRDMTKAQFAAALKRNGFKSAIAGIWYEDTTGRVSDTVMFGAVYQQRPFRLHRRATIARLIERREQHEKHTAGKKRRAA